MGDTCLFFSFQVRGGIKELLDFGRSKVQQLQEMFPIHM